MTAMLGAGRVSNPAGAGRVGDVTHRLAPLAVLLTLLALPACGGDGRSGDAEPARPPHPCDVVPAEVATDLLGTPVTTKRIDGELVPDVQNCSYVPTDQSPGAPFLELMSTPDGTSVDDLVRLTGEDLEHHPVDVPGADEAEAMLDPEIAPTVTVFATLDGVVHTVVLGLDDVEEAERIAVEAAGLLVAGD
jgi:hypothetical protein